jgi:hypothetical protein
VPADEQEPLVSGPKTFIDGERYWKERALAAEKARDETAATIAHAECLEIAERWAAQYPVDVFLPEGTGIEARAAHHARRVAGFIAEDIRKLAVENRPSPSGKRECKACRWTAEDGVERWNGHSCFALAGKPAPSPGPGKEGE